jgi:hypothetical protein
MLEGIGDGLRSQALAFPCTGGPVCWQRFSFPELLRSAIAAAA